MSAQHWMGIAALAGAAGSFAISPAQADGERFALACIGTETGEAVNYAWRWGDRPWHQEKVYPGKWHALYWDYDYPGQKVSPQLQVRYDDDLRSAKHMVVSRLDRFAADSTDCDCEGKRYYFRRRGMEIYLFTPD